MAIVPSSGLEKLRVSPMATNVIWRTFVVFAFGGTLLVVVGIVVLATVFDWRFGRPPDLPAFGRPAGAVQLFNVSSCGGSGSAPPCRSVAFGSTRPFEEVFSDLVTAYESRGWHADNGTLVSPGEPVCVFYFPTTSERYRPLQAEITQSLTAYKIVVEAHVRDCDDRP